MQLLSLSKAASTPVSIHIVICKYCCKMLISLYPNVTCTSLHTPSEIEKCNNSDSINKSQYTEKLSLALVKMGLELDEEQQSEKGADGDKGCSLQANEFWEPANALNNEAITNAHQHCHFGELDTFNI